MLHSHKGFSRTEHTRNDLKRPMVPLSIATYLNVLLDCVIVPAIRHQCNNIQCRIHQQTQYFHSKIILSRFLRIHFTKHYPNFFVFSKCFFNICNRKTILCHILLSKHKKTPLINRRFLIFWLYLLLAVYANVRASYKKSYQICLFLW